MWRKQKESSNKVLLSGSKCPSFFNMAVLEDGETCMAFSELDFKATYVVLFFFPMDRSVDYSELMAFKELLEQFRNIDCQVVGVTSDSLMSILKWIKMDPKQGGTGGPLNFTILSDKNLSLAKMFGVKSPSGMPARATFIMDKDRKVRHSSIYPRVVGRCIKEVLRTTQAIKEVDKHLKEEEDVAIPAGWKQGEEVIINTFQGRKDYYKSAVKNVEEGESGWVGDDEDEKNKKSEDGGEKVTENTGP